MRRPIIAACLGIPLSMSAVTVAAPAASAQGHEQIVFSGEAEGSAGEVGFWIWCAVDESGGYDDCAGAIHFDDLKLARHVEGEVEEVGDDAYQMVVASTRDSAIACTLVNETPTLHGPHNTVDISCSSPPSSASTSEAVVAGG
jgi:hypothetical protein